ncbi:MAG: RNA polymerase sigma factor [Candidatus Rifleibacteriota bacterium]
MNHSSVDKVYDAEFVTKLRRREQSAFKKMFDDFAGLVFSRAVIILGDAASAEDATQEVFYKAYRSLPVLKDGRVKPWLLTITRNHCFDEIRKRKCRPICVNQPYEPPDKKVVETPSAFLEEVSRLPEEMRIPLMLKVVEGLKYKEIAQIVDKAEGTLRNLVCKSLKILRKGLEK